MVLLQEIDGIEKPVYFLSHNLSKTQRSWCIFEIEAYAIMYALNELDHYLADTSIPFIIRTDHRPLESLRNSKQKNRKLQMWSVALSAYNYEIEFISGKDNIHADYFSRYAIPKDKCANTNVINLDRINLQAQTSPLSSESESAPPQIQPPILDIPGDYDIIAAQQADPTLRKIIQQLSNNTASEHIKTHFSLIDNILYYITPHSIQIDLRLVIPQNLRKLILHHLHDKNSHLGVNKTFDIIRKRYYMKQIFQDVADHVARCVTCNTRQLNTNKTPMQHTDITSFCFEKISIDTSGKYPTTPRNNRYIVTIYDHFSGWVDAFCTEDKTAETIAKILIYEIFPRYSIPLQILSDGGGEYCNSVMDHITKHLGINHIVITPWRPQSNAKIERFHNSMHNLIAKHCFEKGIQDWDKYVNFVLSAIRTSPGASTKFSPHFLVYKQDPILPIETILRPRTKYLGQEEHRIDLQRLHIAYSIVRSNIKKSQDKTLSRENEDAKNVDFHIKDPVYIFNAGKNSKHDVRWHPYHRIIRQTAPLTFVVRNLITWKTKKVHKQHLKLAKLDEWNIPPPKRNIRRAQLAHQRDSETTEQSASENAPLPTPPVRVHSSDADSESVLLVTPLRHHRRYRKCTQHNKLRKTRVGRSIVKPLRYRNDSSVNTVTVRHNYSKPLTLFTSLEETNKNVTHSCDAQTQTTINIANIPSTSNTQQNTSLPESAKSSTSDEQLNTSRLTS